MKKTTIGITSVFILMMGLQIVIASKCPNGISYCNPSLPFDNPDHVQVVIGSGGSGGSIDYTNIAMTNKSNTFLLTQYFNQELNVLAKAYFNDTVWINGGQGDCEGSPSSACSSYGDYGSCATNNWHGNQCSWNDHCTGNFYGNCNSYNSLYPNCQNASGCSNRDSSCQGTYSTQCSCDGETYPNCNCGSTYTSCSGNYQVLHDCNGQTENNCVGSCIANYNYACDDSNCGDQASCERASFCSNGACSDYDSCVGGNNEHCDNSACNGNQASCEGADNSYCDDSGCNNEYDCINTCASTWHPSTNCASTWHPSTNCASTWNIGCSSTWRNTGFSSCSGFYYTYDGDCSALTEYNCGNTGGCTKHGSCGAGQYTCSASCSTYNNNQGSCEATSGCSWNGAGCDGYGSLNCPDWSSQTCPTGMGCTITSSCDGNLQCNGYQNINNCNAEAGCGWNIMNPQLTLQAPVGNNITFTNDGANNLIINYDGIIWVKGQISATGYLTRTQVNNDTKVLDKFKTPSQLYNTNGTINDSAFENCSVMIPMTDYSRPQTLVKAVCDALHLKCQDKTIYPYTKNVSMVDNTCLNAMIYHAMQIYIGAIKPDGSGNVIINKTLVADDIVQQSRTYKTIAQGKSGKNSLSLVVNSSSLLDSNGNLVDSRHPCYTNSSSNGISTTCQIAILEDQNNQFKACLKKCFIKNKPSECASLPECSGVMI